METVPRGPSRHAPPLMPLPLAQAAYRGVMMAALLALAGCDDALMHHHLPPAQDCAQRGGSWRVLRGGHVGVCTLPPGGRVAGWTIAPHPRARPPRG
ncbi:hypothetical protein [Komagataeibacter saccharivorans]|uniref:hypothetical protein n=1 Tax=Komagataeibacter saccharivorans TaxID=265959 RepID=UPI001FB69713|nr:hypothetical protein [Komagataeibacter saccharivorans]